MNPLAILSCGEVLWDLFPDGPRFGGAPANFACHAARLGAQVSLLSAVGDDTRGHEAIAILQGFGIAPSLIRVIADAPTGAVGVTVDAAGKPSFEIRAGAAWDQITWTPELATALWLPRHALHCTRMEWRDLGWESSLPQDLADFSDTLPPSV